MKNKKKIGMENLKDNLSLIVRLKSIVRMLGKGFSGKYPMKKRNMLFAVLAGIYLISPIDIIPELPFAAFGLLDDAAILAFVFATISKELDKFFAWEKENEVSSDTEKDATTIVIDEENA